MASSNLFPHLSSFDNTLVDPADIQIVAPALLQLNRGGQVLRSESLRTLLDTCPTTCGIPVATFPGCTECQDSTNVNLKCDACWTDSASPCEDDDCDIPQACYDENCATESCIDSACAAETCDDVACAETVHCNSTCFDTSCIYEFGDDTPLFSPQECGQGHCFGFLPAAQGMPNDMLYQCPQAISTHGAGLWDQGPQHEHDHINLDNRHKRRKMQSSEVGPFSQSYPSTPMPDQQWSYGHYNHCQSTSFGFQPDFNFVQPICRHPEYTNPYNVQGMLDSHAMSLPGSQMIETADGRGHFHYGHCNMPSQVTDHASDAERLYDMHCVQGNCSSPVHEHRTCKHGLEPAFMSRNVLKESTGEGRPFKKPTRLLPAPIATQGIKSSSTLSPRDSLDVLAGATSTSKQSCELDLTCKWVSEDGSLCGCHFTCTKDLDEHLQKAHTSKLGPQSFTCLWQDCNTLFKHRGKLNRHISGAHSHYHAYTCSHTDPLTLEPCNRTFCTKEQLKNHETTHTGERKYKCRFCEHTSATKTQHNTHERIHTKEKPYKCAYCGHRSGDSSNLSKHVRNKHPGMPGGRARPSVKEDGAGPIVIEDM